MAGRRNERQMIAYKEQFEVMQCDAVQLESVRFEALQLKGRERWFPLQGFPCPRRDCRHEIEKTKWVCAQDNNQLYISESGYLSCLRSRYTAHSAKVCKWRFDCGKHGNHPVGKWRSSDLEGVLLAISMAYSLTSKAGATWTDALLSELRNQYDNGETNENLANDESHNWYAKRADA